MNKKLIGKVAVDSGQLLRGGLEWKLEQSSLSFQV